MISAEQRAKEIIDAEWEFIKANDMFVSAGTLDRIQASLTQAITQAENDKLDEAAAWADKWLKTFGKYQPEHISAQRWATDAVKDVATQIRSLKSKD